MANFMRFLPVLVSLIGTCTALVHSEADSPSFTIDYKGNTFLKDGQPFQYVSGSVHYFRIMPTDWDDRLAKMRAAGLNAIQVYVAWNFHETQPGKFSFTGQADLEAFLLLAKKHDLLVIVRAGPYICAEWDFGGLPAWLLQQNSSMVLRSSDPQFMKAVDAWMAVLLPKLGKHLYANGGSVIMVQLENEYGSTGQCDVEYITHLYQLGRHYLGNQTVLFSTDGQAAGFLKCAAKVKLFYPTVDFGPEGTGSLNDTFAPLRAFQPNGPLVNSEYYAGWLDNWYGQHSHVDAHSVATGLGRMLAYGVNVNIYMFIGGTNFGFTNGANAPPLSPQPTSYDYDAPLSENGDTTFKYHLIRQVIANFTGRKPPPVPANATSMSMGRVKVRQLASLLNNLDSFIVKQVSSMFPVTMESLGQYQGFALYWTRLPAGVGLEMATQYSLAVGTAKDYVYAFGSNDASPWDGQFLGSISYRDHGVLNFSVQNPASVKQLWLLVENCGHVNYGGAMQGDVKGFAGNVTLNGVALHGWKNYAIDFGRIARWPWTKRLAVRGSLQAGVPAQASLYVGSLMLTKSDLADTYANMSTFCKGQLWINGFNLGRYWPCAGPQVTLYVPKSVLREGNNTVSVLELLKAPCANDDSCHVDFLGKPNIGQHLASGGAEAPSVQNMVLLQPAEQVPMVDILRR